MKFANIYDSLVHNEIPKYVKLGSRMRESGLTIKIKQQYYSFTFNMFYHSAKNDCDRYVSLLSYVYKRLKSTVFTKVDRRHVSK